MVFTPRNNIIIPNDFQLTINSTEIVRVEHTKFLGVTIDNKLTWTEHINEILSHLRRFVGIFYKISFFLPRNVLKILYSSLVHSKILYAIEIYANTFKTYLHDLHIINNRILRIVLGKDRYCSTMELYILGNTLPIEILFKYKLMLYAHAIYFKCPSLPKFIFNNVHSNSQVHDHDTRTRNDFHIELSLTNIGAKITNSLAFKYWNSLSTDIKQIQSKNLF